MRNKTLSKTTLYICIGLLTFAASCKPKTMTAEKLSEYVADPDHGLSQVRKTGDMEMKLTYRPSSLIVMQEAGEKQPCDSLLDKAMEKYKPHHYFVLQIKTAEGKDPVYRGQAGHAKFSERLQDLAFHMGEYVYAVSDTDTIPLADSYFPNLYGMGGSSQVLLIFVKPKEGVKQIEVVIEEMGFGLGRQKFTFEQDDVDNVPGISCD